MKTKLAFSALILTLLTACVINGQAEYEQGLQLAEQQNYQQAIHYFEQALEKEPNNAAYQAKLAQVQGLMIKQIIAPVQNVLAGEASHINDFNTAIAAIKKVEKIDQSTANQFYTQLKQQRVHFNAKAQNAFESAQSQIAQQNWAEAIELLQGLQVFYPNYRQSESVLKQTQTQAVNAYLINAKQALNQAQFSQAKTQAEQILALDAGNEQAQLLLEQIKIRNSKEYYIAQAGKAEKKKQWQKAEALYNKALNYSPNNRNILSKIKRIKVNKELTIISKSNGYLADGYLYKAYLGYQEAKNYNFAKNAVQLNALKMFLSARINARADNFFIQQKYANAYFWFDLMSQIMPDNTELKTKLVASKTEIDKSLKVEESPNAENFLVKAEQAAGVAEKIEYLVKAKLVAEQNEKSALINQITEKTAQLLSDYRFQ
ncbi:tetratricopeptide repeat protein [Catenovulum sp. 2E275]|uniref:tetratricopeptide repeat protein n=1 Tax=Catenovulum sp. 2E275 TaxID=2980497 RepID=UPI0021D39792|nr:tetratricopeptide repeat protein [Catenovulum sp. 2E275]MCU4676589.1 tetratricopeptide repeat protein [Catenovulum sp. 2E275]